MSEIDEFAGQLLEEAKRFFERAQDARKNGHEGEAAFLHAALMLAFCSLEAHVGAVGDDLCHQSQLPPTALAVLKEKEVQFLNGEFTTGKNGRFYKLEDRILLLHRLGPKPDVDGTWRASLTGAIDLRNKLTHPKAAPQISSALVQKALEAVIDTLDALYKAVYRRRFPAANRKLQSKLSFDGATEEPIRNQMARHR